MLMRVEEVIRGYRTYGISHNAFGMYALLLGALLLLLPIDSSAAPTVTSHQPASGASVPINFTVQAIFNEPLDPASIATGSLSLYRVGAPVIAAGRNHTVALKSDHSVAAWGLNSHGQTTVPEGLTGVTAIAAGDLHTVALKSDSTVLAWGDNSYGQTAVPAGLSGVTAIAAGGNCTFALKDNGTIAAWGDTSSGQCTVPSGLTGVTALVAGGSHAVALKNDGTLVAWGDNSSGQTTLPADLSGVVAIAAGRMHTVALKRNGTVVAWGDTSYNQTDLPAGLSGIVAIVAGYDHSIALRNDGTVIAWGRNDSGQIAIPVELSGIIAVAGGAGHSVGVKNDGTVVAWGANDFGEAAVPAGLVGLVPVVDGTLDYDTATLTATFTPSGPAVSGASYYADVDGVRNQSGAVLVSPVRWGFMAVDAALPSITPLTNDFGNVAVNVTSASKTFTLGNTGTKSLAVSAVTLEGTDAGLFGVTPGSCPSLTPTIAAGGSCTVNVAFTPTAAGVKGANLRVTSDATINPELNVPLGGTGVIPVFTLSGTVTSSAGTPINGATVTATGGYTTTTNQSGQYQLVRPAGVVTITVSAFAHQAQTVADLVLSGNTARDFTLALDATAAAVQVAVVDGSGHGWPLYARIGIAGNSAPVFTNPLTGETTLFLYQNSTYALTVTSLGYSAATRDITPTSGASSESFVLTVDQSYCMAPGYPALSFVNLEKNAGGYATTKPAYWSCGTPTNRTPHSGSTACFADLSSGGHMDYDTYLYSPNMDLRANAGSSLTLSWWQMMGISSSNEGLYVDVSKDGGYSWSNVYLAAGWDWRPPEPTWTKHSITLDSSYAVSNFKIRFNFWGYRTHTSYTYWYIDDVAVQTQNSCPLQPGGLLVGAVHDSITNAGLNNVTISDSANRTAVSLATPEDTSLDDGFYTFFLPAGAHDVTASATGFQPQTINGVTIASNSIATQDFALNVVPLSVTTSSLAFGIQGSAYTRTVSATGGHPPYTWSIISGALPDGLTVNSATGTIGGTPTTTGTSVFTVQATDAIGVTASNTYSVSIYSPMSISTASLPFAVTGSAYGQTLSATGGLPPYTWSISAGALPAGLSLNTGTGVLSGTPTATGTFNFTVKATVANNDSVTRPFSMIVYNPLAISSGNSYYSAGSAYSQTLVATGGKPPYSWAIISGALPAGMTLDSISGIISGTSAAVGTSSFTLQATDANATVISKAVTLTSYLAVTGIQPAIGSTVPADAVVVRATFSEPLNPVTVTAGNVMLYRNGGVRAVAAGGNHTVVLKTGGTVTAWGYNGYGISTVPAGLSGVTSIAAGEKHTLALKSDGTAVAWGLNDYGQITVPEGLSGVVALSAGNNHTLALKNDGTVVAWGDNSYGQSTVPAGLTGVIAVAAGTNYSLAVKNDNTVVAWGYNGSGQATPPAGLTGVVAISAGVSHAVALKSDGAVVSWGSTSNGQGTVPAGLAGVIAIAAGSYHTVALKADGTVVAWGRNYEGQTTVPAGLDGVIAVAAGGNHTVALKGDGTVAAWGYNGYGESGVPAGLSVSGNTVSGTLAYDAPSRTVTFAPSTPLLVDTYHYVKIAGVTSQAGVSLAAPVNWNFKSYVLYISTAALPYGTTGAVYNHRLVVDGGSAPFTWSITSGALPAGLTLDSGTGIISGTATEAVTTGLTVQVTDATAAVFSKALSLTIHPTVTSYYPASGAIVQVDTAVRATFSDPLDPATVTPVNFTVSPGSAPKAIAAGGQFTAALKNDGTVASWGSSVVPAGLTGVTAIAAAGGNTVTALKSDGTVIVGGYNQYGPITLPAGLTGVTAIATGDCHTVALKGDGTAVAWGCNGDNRTTVPAGLSGVVAIAAGTWHTVALKNDGRVVAWGTNSQGQSSVPGELAGVTAIAAGYYHTVALKSDGTVVAWGANGYGQTAVPAGLTGVIAIAAGYYHTVALKSDGTVVAWGSNGYGQTTVPAGLTGVIAIASGSDHVVALKNDGTVVSWGDTRNKAVPAAYSSSGVVSGTLTYDPASLTATFTPSAQLIDGAVYYATIAGVTTQTGVLLATPFAWSFTALDPKYPLNVAFAGTGAGSVNLSTGGSCASDCSQSIRQGSVVTVTAVPAANTILSGWTGCDSVIGDQCTVTVSDARNVTATFMANGAPVTLTVDKIGSGSGTVTSAPAGINLTETWYGSAQFAAGTVVTLTAAPDSGSNFSSWRGACSGMGNCTVTINANTTVSAAFTTTGTGNPGPVKMNNQFFLLFQDAYNSLLDGATTTIYANSLNIYENLVFNRNVAVTLKGGYDNSFGTNSGQTILLGTLTITSGSVVLENIIIQ